MCLNIEFRIATSTIPIDVWQFYSKDFVAKNGFRMCYVARSFLARCRSGFFQFPVSGFAVRFVPLGLWSVTGRFFFLFRDVQIVVHRVRFHEPSVFDYTSEQPLVPCFRFCRFWRLNNREKNRFWRKYLRKYIKKPKCDFLAIKIARNR